MNNFPLIKNKLYIWQPWPKIILHYVEPVNKDVVPLRWRIWKNHGQAHFQEENQYYKFLNIKKPEYIFFGADNLNLRLFKKL